MWHYVGECVQKSLILAFLFNKKTFVFPVANNSLKCQTIVSSKACGSSELAPLFS